MRQTGRQLKQSQMLALGLWGTETIDEVFTALMQRIDVHDWAVKQRQALARLSCDPRRHVNGVEEARAGVFCTQLSGAVGEAAFSWGGEFVALVAVDQCAQSTGALNEAVEVQEPVIRGGVPD